MAKGQRGEQSSDLIDPTLDHSWSDSRLDSFRIDILLRKINEISENVMEGDNAIRLASLIKQLCLEIVTKLPIRFESIKTLDEKRVELRKHLLIVESHKLFITLLQQDLQVSPTDYDTINKLLFNCLYYKQNVLKLGLRYEEKDDGDITTRL